MFLCKNVQKTVSLLILNAFLAYSVEAAVVFTTEENGTHDQTFYIDSGDISTDFIDLEFGTSIDAKLRYDVVNDKFELNRDLGIGDPTPDHTLDVAGNIGVDAGGYFNLGDTDGAAGYGLRDNSGTLEFRANQTTATWRPLGTALVDADEDTMVQVEESANENMIRFDSNGLQRMVIDNTGNIDIKNSTGATDVIVINEGKGSSATAPDFQFDTDGLLSATSNMVLNIDSDNNETGANFRVMHNANNTTTATELLRLDEEGDLGLGGETNPQHSLDIAGTGTQIEIGDGTANDHIINFDEGIDRNFGWDDSDSTLSTFNNLLAFRTYQSATPPATCSATVAGAQWMDTDTGILYICDTSNGRNKWLSVNEFNIFGDESGTCPAGQDANSNANCNVDWGNGLGPDGATDLGIYIPHNTTITGYGFSADNDACTSGSFDVEVWGTNSNTDDNNYSLLQTVAAGLNGETHNGNNLNLDLVGDQYLVWGIDNNCGQSIDDWNVILYFRYRHN